MRRCSLAETALRAANSGMARHGGANVSSARVHAPSFAAYSAILQRGLIHLNASADVATDPWRAWTKLPGRRVPSVECTRPRPGGFAAAAHGPGTCAFNRPDRAHPGNT